MVIDIVKTAVLSFSESPWSAMPSIEPVLHTINNSSYPASNSKQNQRSPIDLMAFRQVFIIFTFIAAIVPSTTFAKEFIVGDESGWRIGFDYQNWARGKDFQVGDKLVFQYTAGAHNVFKVNGTGFQNCIVPPANEALSSGNDTIILATPGRKWYICGVGKHCEVGGQKLFIIVQPSSVAPAMSPGIASSVVPAKSMPYSSKGDKMHLSVLITIASIVAMFMI